MKRHHTRSTLRQGATLFALLLFLLLAGDRVVAVDGKGVGD